MSGGVNGDAMPAHTMFVAIQSMATCVCVLVWSCSDFSSCSLSAGRSDIDIKVDVQQSWNVEEAWIFST